MVKDSSSRDSGVKKRRKTTPEEPTDQEMDIYKKSVQFEEKEALSRSPEADAKLYFETCKNIRQLLFEIYDLKSLKTADAQTKIQEKCTEACLLITVLRKLNRYDKFRSLVTRDLLVQEKQKSDSINLQCQNLLYEYEYLQSECNKCRQFKSKDENIDLVPVEEFFKEAPESLTGKIKNMSEDSENYKHELHLARLEWELMQRKQLAELCNTFEEEKKQLAEEIVELKNRLEGLGPRLNAVLEATKPLQEHLGLPFDKIRAEHELARLLPNPLYLFYANTDAFKSVYPKLGINVEIQGDSDEATAWKEKRDSMPFSDYESEPEAEAQEEANEVGSKKRRHRKSTHQERKEERKSKLLEVHPLTVELSLKVPDGPKLRLKFSYLSYLKIVTVVPTVNVPNNITGSTAREVLHGESVIGALFDDDDFGKESPNPANAYLLRKKGLGAFRDLVQDVGFAYRWAQKVCGLDFLSSECGNSSSQIGQENVAVVSKALSQRFRSRAALAAQMQQLDSNLIPLIPDGIDYPKSAVSTLTNWTSSSWQKVCQTASAQNLIENDLIGQSDLFYTVSVARLPAVLQGIVAIKNSYPLQAPIFVLTLNYNGVHHSGNNDEIRDMERALNTIENPSASSAPWLLSVQLRHLCAYLDVYLETVAPNAFPQSTVFFKSVCGRNHRRPFKFRKIGAGIYTQQ